MIDKFFLPQFFRLLRIGVTNGNRTRRADAPTAATR
jgi:hypothetical protein